MNSQYTVLLSRTRGSTRWWCSIMFDTPKHYQTPKSKLTHSHKNGCWEDPALTIFNLIHSVNMDDQQTNNPGSNPQTYAYISLPTHRSPNLFLNLFTDLVPLITLHLPPPSQHAFKQSHPFLYNTYLSRSCDFFNVPKNMPWFQQNKPAGRF